MKLNAKRKTIMRGINLTMIVGKWTIPIYVFFKCLITSFYFASWLVGKTHARTIDGSKCTNRLLQVLQLITWQFNWPIRSITRDTNTIHWRYNITLTLKMTTAQVVEASVTVTNSSFQNYTHPDDHSKQTTDTPGFKLFTKQQSFKD